MSILKTPARPPRQRRSAEAARANILAAAERLLIAAGPQALKLVDVAQEAGVANASVLHHFGSISAVQTALMERMIIDLVARILAIHEAGANSTYTGAQALFDAFEAPGAARLAAWMEMTGEAQHLTMVRGAVESVVSHVMERTGLTREAAEDLIMTGVVMALGVGLFGRPFSILMGKAEGHARALSMVMLMEYAVRRIAP